MRIIKFGGSSISTSANILKVKKIVDSNTEYKVIVVSAFGSVTDLLIKAAQSAALSNRVYEKILKNIETIHINIILDLIEDNKQQKILKEVKKKFADLLYILYGIFLLKELTNKTLDYVMSFGERLSAFIISSILKDTEYIDARSMIKTDREFGNAKVNKTESYKLIKDVIKKTKKKIIIGGFIASSKNNETTTLGRGGSDLSASLVTAALKAEILEIWTDVSGFYTADPRIIKKAHSIAELTYAEAMELSHFGAKVIYAPTITPLLQKNIPILIKNTFDPDSNGTLIKNESSIKTNTLIKGMSSIDNITLLNLQGSGMVGITGISKRLFSALSLKNINIILISQASSECSISFAVNSKDADLAKKIIDEEFEQEIILNRVQPVNIEKKLSIIAIVGENMRKTPGISGKLFETLGRNGINIIAIAQGASELNISFVISSKDIKKALTAIHDSFFLSEFIEENIFISGIGTVGDKLINQIRKQQKLLLEEYRLKIKVIGIANSKKMIVNENGINLETYKEKIIEGKHINVKSLKEKIISLNLPNFVFVDCTASEKISEIYNDILDNNISIVTANKIACSSSIGLYNELKKTAQKRGTKFFYETNVGAGLPIIGTIKDLVKSGDKILEIQAVLSGTLNFIFNSIDSDISLSKAIHLAKENGYSEPDPRIDLNGTDVVRKLLILSREAGYNLEIQDINIQDFLPEECKKAQSIEEFFQIISKYDTEFEERRIKLKKENKKWRYIANFDNGNASVGLKTINKEHPFYELDGNNNVLLIRTRRYKENPLMIKGSGAGASVTAAGVFADIIRVMNI